MHGNPGYWPAVFADEVRNVKFRYFQRNRAKRILAARLAVAIMAAGTLSCGCSATVPSDSEAMTAANWDTYSYDGWNSFFLPTTIATTPSAGRSKTSTHVSMRTSRALRQFVRSGQTDPRWVRTAESDSELFLENQQVLELPQRLDSGDTAVLDSNDVGPTPAATNDRYGNLLESGSGLHANLKAAAFMP
jgi:hypothetical protein